MNVNKWGPSGWIFLHTITFNYPEKPTKQLKLSSEVKAIFIDIIHP